MPNLIINSWNDECENINIIEDFSDFLFKSSRYNDVDNVIDIIQPKLILIEVFLLRDQSV